MPNDGTAGNTDQGQSGIFDPYLADVPEDAKPAVEGYLKGAERFVNERVQSAAELERKFGAYQDLDLSNFTPEQAGQVLGWYTEVSSNPDAFRQWLADTAQEQGVTLPGGETEDQFANEDIPQTKAEFDAAIAAAVSQAIAPLQETVQGTAQETHLSNLAQRIDQDFAALERAHNITLTDEDKQTIVDLGESAEGDDWIAQGFKRLQTIQGEAAAEFVNDRRQQPSPAIPSGGQPAPENVTDWKEAERMAAERLRQAFSTR